MIKAKKFLLLIALLFLALNFGSCGGGGGSSDGGGSSNSGGGSNGGGGGSSTSSVIGTSGGSVSLNDLTVNIPANLLSQDAKVTLTEVSPSTLQIDNNSVLGTPVQITIEPVSSSSTTALRDVQIKSFWGDVKQSMSIYWNNIDEAKAAISAGICLSTKVVTPTVGSIGRKILSIPCKISNSTAVATEVLFLQWGNTSAQKFIGTYGLISNQIKELNIPPSLKSLALTDANQLGESREFDNSPLNGRTAVILIHGINRDENLGRDCPLNNSDKERFWCYEYKRNVWNAFYEEAAKKAGFYNKFKVYEYVYPSFKSSALDNGPSLSSMIQNDPELANSKVFLVAHSYGGLVARQAMNANNGVLGNQTINLFTLATPHHGSIGASLLNLMPGTLNDPVADAFLSDTKTLIALNLAKVYYGAAVYTQGYIDLQWDNFDGGIPQHYTNNFNVFTNDLLKTFNEGRDNFKGKIITYSGGNVGVLDPTVVNDILNSSDLSDALGKIPDTISLNEVILWFAAETIKRFGEYNDDSNPPNYPDSDGMVPRSSANFEAGGVTNDLVLDDVNHEQIFDDLRVINTIQNKMMSTYTVSGRVTSNGAGMAGVTISWSVTNGSGGGGGSITTDSNGNYQIGVQNGYTYTITPSMSGYTFTPTSRTGAVNSADVTGQDFVGTAVTNTINLPETGQTTCYDTAGNVIACAGTGQDGELQMGVAWPSPRFTDNGNGTVTDNLTGLMWLKDANCIATQYPGFDTDGTAGNGMVTWQNTLNFVAGINNGTYSNCGAGYNDWRLPNRKELRSLINDGQTSNITWLNTQGFNNVQFNAYWSSTTKASNTDSAVTVFIRDGYVDGQSKSGNNYAWPVRAGGGASVDLPKTGQTISYASGDDGDLERGVAWPSPRFTDNGNGTVTDNLTGLMWLKDANCIATQYPSFDTDGTADGRVTWQNGLNFVAGINNGTYSNCGAGYTDWRLPNVNELESLTNAGQLYYAWLNTQGFSNVQAYGYWSSTTYAYLPTSFAWNVNMYDWCFASSCGVVDVDNKTYIIYVWPVRGGTP